MANNELDANQGRLIHHSEEFDKLRELVMHHKVCWEVWPEYYINKDGSKLQIGFELELIGTHYHPEQSPLPGCEECVKVFNDLKQVADYITHKEEHLSRYELRIFVPSINYSPRRNLRKDVTLTIKILHRDGFDRPVDGCEVECLKEMEGKLKDLGAQREHWKESTGIR